MKNTVKTQTKLLKNLGLFMIAVLILEYILGMASNLFVSFPADENTKLIWKFVWTQVPLAFHMLVGMLLFVVSIAILAIAIKQHAKKWMMLGTLGIFSIFASSLTGSQFISTQSSISSFMMSFFFMLAFIAYGLAVSNLF